MWNLKGFSSDGHGQWTYRTKVGEVHRNQHLSPLQPISYVYTYVLFLQISLISFLLTQYPLLTWWLHCIFIDLNRMFFYFHSTYVNKFYVYCRKLYHLKFPMLYDCACSLSDGDFKKYACSRNTLGHKVVKCITAW